MKKKCKHLLALLLYGGIDKADYQGIAPDIDRKNRDALSLASVLCSVMFLALLIGSLISSTMSAAKILYAVLLAISAGIFLLLRSPLKRGRWTVRVLWYVLLIALGTYAVLLNTLIRPNLSAVTLCVFLVAGPLLVIERPYRIQLIQLLLVAEYLIGVLLSSKPYLVAFADCVNILCCAFLGSAIYIRMTTVRLREALQARLLQRERDIDKLTGLLNKAAIKARIRSLLSDPHQQGALVIMDVDNFKSINDHYGHAYGDLVLSQAAGCIRRIVPEGSLCGRFGGDEFLVLLPEVKRDGLIELLDTLSREMASTIKLPDPASAFTVSMGAAPYPSAGSDYPTLFQAADTALYEVKKAAKNGWKLDRDLQHSF